MENNIVIIYQKQHGQLLKETISSGTNVVAWIMVEEIIDNIEGFEAELNRIHQRYVNVKIGLMIHWQPYKHIVWTSMEKIGVGKERIFDIYKAYMAGLPRKRYKRIMERRKGEKLDGLVLGISHGLTGILEEKMPGKVCNLCESSQDIYFNYKVLESVYKEYPECLSTVKYVVFDMFDYTYFNFDTILTGAYEAYLEESGFYCEDRTNWNKEVSVDQINHWLEMAWKEGENQQSMLDVFFPGMRNEEYGLYKGYTLLKTRQHVLTEQEILEYKRNFRESSLQRNVFENTTAFQISNFEKILKLLKQINPDIKVFLLLLPKHYEAEQKEKVANARWKSFFYDIVEELKKEYSFVRFLDLKDCEGFSKKNELYEDMTHFNYDGAKLFSEYLNTILNTGYGVMESKKRQDAFSNWQTKAVGELISAFNAKAINENNISQLSCYHMAALLDLMRKNNNGKAFYLKIKNYLEEINIQRLKKQDKIVIGFIANYSSTWIGDELYRLFEQNDRFEPYVFLIANFNAPNIERVKEEYAKNLSFFKEHNLRVVQTLDLDTGRQYSWEELGIKPQICIWLTPWTDLFREHFHLLNYSLDILHTYIPYGFMLAENEDNTFVHHQYNQIMHNVAWKCFWDSQKAVEMAEKYTYAGSENGVYTGYPKMDSFFEKKPADVLWNRLAQENGTNPKRIIYAPHHAIEKTGNICVSTFASNYLIMQELAKKYSNDTIWIFKPHPQLRYKAIQAGIFKDSEEWEAYVNQWKEMKNAQVVEEGSYTELFIHSDAMIMDSVSFLAEYLHTDKPLLYLIRDKVYLNQFGKDILENYYVTSGENTETIEWFICEIVLNGQDKLQKQRKVFFEKNLDYYQKFGQSAAGNIYKEFTDVFGE